MFATNELQPLSNDLTIITTEIKSYENIAGQSIFEIGRRLKWVKDNDLTHGQYLKWLKDIHIQPRQAQRFVKVATELPNTTTWSHLGTRVLYEIATLPEPEQKKIQKQVEQGEDPTVKQIDSLKKQLKAKDQELADSKAENVDLQTENSNMRKQQVELNQRLAAKDEPKVVEKTVTKEVKPEDYDDMKRQVKELKQDKANLAKRVDDQQAEIDSYKDLQSQERQAQHWQNRGKISVYKLTSNARDFMRANTLTTDDKKAIADASEEALTDLNDCLNDLQKMIDDVRELTSGRRIVEGEIIND